MPKNLLLFVACAMSLSGSLMKSHCSRDGVQNANAYENQAQALQEPLLDNQANLYGNPLDNNGLPPQLDPALGQRNINGQLNINGEVAPLHVDANPVALNEGMINPQGQVPFNNPAPIVQQQEQEQQEPLRGLRLCGVYCCASFTFLCFSAIVFGFGAGTGGFLQRVIFHSH
jgi:hypothetical protein